MSINIMTLSLPENSGYGSACKCLLFIISLVTFNCKKQPYLVLKNIAEPGPIILQESYGIKQKGRK